MPSLYLMRHAKSDWHSAAQTDFERPLNKRGSKDAQRMGQWLHQQNIEPGQILSSPAQRAQQTAIAVAKAMRITSNQIQYHKNLYLADRATLLRILQTASDSVESVLLVAHNPGLDNLVEWLASEPPPLTDSGKLMTTGAIAQFALSAWGKLRRNGGVLQRIQRPRELP